MISHFCSSVVGSWSLEAQYVIALMVNEYLIRDKPWLFVQI
jgi:hypothetical protein